MAAAQSSHGQCGLEAAMCVMGIPELRELIMINLDSPSMFNLISAAPAALRTFLRDPRAFVNAAIDQLPNELRYWARASFVITRDRICEDPRERCRNPRFCWIHTICLEAWDDIFDICSRSPLYHGRVELPHLIEHPIGQLQTLAAVEQAIDTLANSDIWVWVDMVWHPDPLLFRGPYSNRDMLKLELWRFEICSALFYRRTSETVASCGTIGGPLYIQSRRFVRYLREHLKNEDIKLFDLVLHSLMRFIGRFYEKNLATDFEAAYLEEVSSANPHFNPLEVLRSTRSKYTSFVDYQLSLGITGVARILRSKARKYVSEDGSAAVVHRPQNVYFLLRNFFSSRHGRNLVSGTFEDVCCYDFELRRLGDGRRGYHLSLKHREYYFDVGYRERRVDFEQVVFPDESNLIHLGGLTPLKSQMKHHETIVRDGSGYFDRVG